MSKGKTFDPDIFPKQREAWAALFDPEIETVLYGGGAGGGKTFLGCEWLFAMSLTFPNIKSFIARKEKARLKESTLKTFWRVCQKYGAKLERDFVYNDQKSVITFLTTGSEILLLDVKRNPSDPEFDGLGSTEFTIGFGEEVGEWDSMAYDILSTRVGRWRNDEYQIPAKMLLTCNPKKNWVYKMFYKPWTKGELPKHLCYIPSLVTDNPKTPPQYIERLQKLSSDAMKQKLLYGNWDYDESPNDLVEYESINNIFTNEYVPSGKKYITADVARFGKDKTVIRLWDGLRAIQRVSMSSSSITQVVDSIRKLARSNAVSMSNVIVDEDGVGGGVVDTLRCKGFVSNTRPIQIKNNLNYDNLKSQCAFKIAQLINEGSVYDSEKQHQETIEQELSQLKQKEKEDTKKALISKDDMKKSINRSPDDLDNYIMRAYFELKPTNSSPRLYRRRIQ